MSSTMSNIDDNSEFAFAWDIGYALSREDLSRGKRKLNLDDCRAIAARVLGHLRMSNVELRRKPASIPRPSEVSE